MTHPPAQGPQDRLHRTAGAGRPDDMPVIRPDTGLVHPPQQAPDTEVGAAPAQQGRPRHQQGETQFISVFGDVKRSGAWSLASAATAVTTFGDVHLDLREVDLADVTRISAYGCFGDMKVIVCPDVEVQLSGVAIFGGYTFDKRSEPRTQPRRTLLIDGFTLFGDVKVLVLSPGRAAPKRWRWI